MRYGTPEIVGNRAQVGISRHTVDQADDSPLGQQLKIRGFHQETMDTIEHAHPYGFTAVPKSADTGSGGNGSGGGGSGGATASTRDTGGASGGGNGSGVQSSAGSGMKAESFVAFLGGNRSHGIALVTQDRRYRPNNLQEGEVVLHDDQLQQVYVSRDRVVVHSTKEVHVQRGDAHALLTDGKHKLQYGKTSVTMNGTQVYLGKEGVAHKVVTVDGPSNLVFASIDEYDSPMQAAATATRTKAGGSGGSTGGATGGGSGA